MLGQVEKVSPVTVEGIEFYCSSDGLNTGMSQTGLSKFANVHRKSVYNVLSLLDSTAIEELPEWLKPWKLVNVYYDNLLGSNSTKTAQILKADFCADYIEQLAFHHEKPNQGALLSFRKFARIGISSFIKDVTGYRYLFSSQSDIQTILGIVKSLEQKHSLAILVGQAYKTLKLGSPEKIVRKNNKGYNLPPVYGYPERMLSTVKMLIVTMLAS
jgi:hypothetical protein